MRNKWALKEHLSTTENNALWDSAGSRHVMAGR